MPILIALLICGVASPAQETLRYVKITFGVGDTEGRDWSGSVRLDGGEIVDMQPWGFETRHKLAAETHSWVCDSTVQVARGKTRFAEPQRAVVLGLRGSSTAHLTVETKPGSFGCSLTDLRPGRWLLKLDGAARVEALPSPAQIAASPGEEDYPAISVDANGSVWVAWISWEDGADVLRARPVGGSAAPEVLAGPGDFYQVKLASDGAGRVWAVWAAQADGNWDLFARVREGNRWQPRRRLTTASGTDFKHALATDARGNVWMVWQAFRSTSSDLFLRNLSDPNGEELRVTDHPANDWEPALACDASGGVWVAWDTYRDGNYDVYLRKMHPRPEAEIAVAASPEFEAHPSLACDNEGRVWVAYDSAQPNWGKDFARGDTLRTGSFAATLHAYRRLQLRCVTPSGVHVAPVEIPQVLPPSWADVTVMDYGLRRHSRSYDLPHLSTDANGNLWVTYRMNRQAQLGHPPGGAVWEIYTTWFDGRRWSDPMLLPYSRGRNDQRVGTTRDADGNQWFAWPTGSHFRKEDCNVYAAAMPAAQQEAPLRPGAQVTADQPGGGNADAPVSHEWRVGDATYNVYWGDLHRHTDFSLCSPTIDGTLFDAYRYALDSAKLDFLGITDHTRDVPAYVWWQTQKAADLFTIADRFAGFYSYERSNGMGKGGGGHRNLWFPKRGNKVYYSQILNKSNPTPTELYQLLRKEGVECAMGAHTPGWNAKAQDGTWLYNDPVYEPVAEIFQAYRTSYEMPKLDANGNPPKSYNRFLWWALEKGYKLGFIASSDHISTHLSYACVYAEEPTRQSIFRAIQQRRTYAAMDKILVEFSANGHPMGSQLTTRDPVAINAKVIGTAPLAKVEIVKNNEFVYTTEPGKRDCAFDFRDPQASPGTSYYYLRVTQSNTLPNGSPIMAWSSPVWVTVEG